MVGLTCFFAGGLSVWALRSEADVGSDGAGERPATETGPQRRTEEGRVVRAAPESLAECRQTLVQREVELRTARASAARAIRDQIFDDDDLPGPRPAPAAGEGEGETAPAEPSDRERFRAATQKLREAVVSEMEITPEEQAALADSVCPRRENERSLYYDFAEGSIDTPTLMRLIRDERREATQAMTRALGRERYQQLRDFGGLGVVSRGLCGRR